MPDTSNQVIDQAPGEKTSLKRVLFVGTESETIKNGYCVCYNYDYGTASATEWGRVTRVEKPATANLGFFAGVITGLPADGYVITANDAANGKRLNIVDGRLSQGCIAYVNETTTTLGDLLGISNGSYYLTKAGSPTVAALLEDNDAAGNALVMLSGG